jgi:hypothetical protein
MRHRSSTQPVVLLNDFSIGDSILTQLPLQLAALDLEPSHDKPPQQDRCK